MTHPPKLPAGYGVVEWRHKIIVYQATDEIVQEKRKTENGVYTFNIATGKKHITARHLGDSDPMPEIPADLTAIIQADLNKRNK